MAITTHWNQSGFTAIEAFLSIGLVAVLVLAIIFGFKAHDRAKVATVTPSPSAIASAKASPTATPGNYLVIKELGIEVPLAPGIEDLKYTYSYDTDLQAETAQLGSSNCDVGSLGEIVKIQGTIPSNVEPYNGGPTNILLLKQYSGFWLQHVPSQNATCTDDSVVQLTDAAVRSVQLTE